MCKYIHPIQTKTQFILLMHPKEFKRTKNGTGHFTHLSLSHSQLYVGIDFSNHTQINALLNDTDTECYVLYPSQNSINLNEESLANNGKNIVLFILDSTWPCSRAMLRASPNIDKLPKVSFTHTSISSFRFKKQPKSYCLSTMESTLCVLELLNIHKIEKIKPTSLEHFLSPFHEMVAFQVSCNV